MRRPGPLLVIGGVFALSIATRAGEVAAELSETGAAEILRPNREKSAAADDPAPTPAAPSYDPNPSLSTPASARSYDQDACASPELFAALRERETELAARAEVVADREAELRIIEKRLEERISILTQTKNQLEETVARTEVANAEDIDRLVRMYQAMKPKEAGAIFNAMEESFAAGFLAEMRPDAAALILANMDADKAYAVSLIIAGRNARAPKR
ncbi:MAG: hypothetical protein AAFR11_10655 [Pseudomonadota bacterium]